MSVKNSEKEFPETPKIIVYRNPKGNSVVRLEIKGHFATRHCHYISGVHNLAFEVLSKNEKLKSYIVDGDVVLSAVPCTISTKALTSAAELIIAYIKKYKLQAEIIERRRNE